MDSTRTGRFWISLGSPKAVRIIYVVMILYALVLGSLMVGYTHVQSCLAKYADLNANALQVRSQSTFDDRVQQKRVDAVDHSDRARIIANQQALSKLVQAAMSRDGTITNKALADLKKTNDASLHQFAKNEVERTSIAQARAAIDKRRADNPIPGPPSEQC